MSTQIDSDNGKSLSLSVTFMDGTEEKLSDVSSVKEEINKYIESVHQYRDLITVDYAAPSSFDLWRINDKFSGKRISVIKILENATDLNGVSSEKTVIEFDHTRMYGFNGVYRDIKIINGLTTSLVHLVFFKDIQFSTT